MAQKECEKVSMSDEEYSELLKSAQTTFKECLTVLKTIKKRIDELTDKNGGLYADNVSANLKKLSEALEAVNKILSVTYASELLVISDFIDTIDKLDSLKIV